MNQSSASPDRQVDYLVIGGGSAGCAAARRLSEKPSNSVILTEAGGDNRSWFVRIPVGNIRTLFTPQYDWCYRTVPDPSRNGKVDLCYRGKGLGGSSAINGTIYVRGAHADFDHWAALGHAGWAWKDVEPVYREMENAVGKPRRGQGGPLNTRTVARPHATTRAFLASAQNLQIPLNDDYNGDNQEGVALIELTQRRGFRHSSADAFLRPVTGRSNLKVATNTEVLKLIVDGKRVLGALVKSRAGTETIYARHTVLSAGALNTPKILMLSGIGDAQALQALGITPVLDNPQVGKNLREHPLVRLIYETNVPTYNNATSPLNGLRHVAEFLRYGEGPLGGVMEAVGFVRSSPDKPVPDLQLHFVALGTFQGEDGKLARADRSGVTVYVNASYPQGTGEVSLVSADPAEPPRLAYNILGDERDVDALVKGIALVQDIMSQNPISDMVVREQKPGFAFAGGDLERARDYVRTNGEFAYHPVGTCAMGTVVSPKLNVLGLEGLSIADASIMPELISGNTNAACMMIGNRLGRWLAEGAAA